MSQPKLLSKAFFSFSSRFACIKWFAVLKRCGFFLDQLYVGVCGKKLVSRKHTLKQLKADKHNRPGHISATVYTPSDARIKTIEGVSDTKKDLEILKQIEVTDYRLKDVIWGESTLQKKVIAQQLKTIYPQAVKCEQHQLIPDIYKMATIKDGWVELHDNDLAVGDKVQLVYDEGKSIFIVTATNQKGFRIDAKLEGDVFVYGRVVNDFHTVDYTAISMLNVSASQALAEGLSNVSKRNTLLKKQMDSLAAENAELKTVVNQLQEQNAELDRRLMRLERLFCSERSSQQPSKSV